MRSEKLGAPGTPRTRISTRPCARGDGSPPSRSPRNRSAVRSSLSERGAGVGTWSRAWQGPPAGQGPPGYSLFLAFPEAEPEGVAAGAGLDGAAEDAVEAELESDLAADL
ncbi:MAG: hypothetical protein RLZZ142_1280 [Verrucomicrobiota bacterium]